MDKKLVNELREMPKSSIEELSAITNKIIKDLKTKMFPVPIVKIMRELGFVVGVQDLDENISGYIIIDDLIKAKYTTDKLICVNSKDSVGHQRFTIAHELAHYLFDYDDTKLGYYNTYNTDDVENDVEMRANKFAANLLMPENEFKKIYKILKKETNEYFNIIEKLMEYFQVSKKAVELRIVELGLN